jgi:putative endonuclease
MLLSRRYNDHVVYVYVLQLANKKLYVGSTKDLRRRLKEHTAGKVSFTQPLLPVRLIYYEAYLESSDARTREKYLKTGNGRRQLRKQIVSFLKRP